MKTAIRSLSVRDFKRQREEFERILAHALERTSYGPLGETELIFIPQEVRKSYYDLFQGTADKKSITSWGFYGIIS